MLFEVNFTIGSEYVAKFNFFFRNLARLTSLLTAPGKISLKWLIIAKKSAF